MKLGTILNKSIWTKWLKHFAPRRFNYTYAVNVLKFRERKSKTLKRANIICFKRGHTKNKYLNPRLTRNGINISLPNYTKAKWWTVPKRWKQAYQPLLNEKNYGKIIRAFGSIFPGIPSKELRRLASWFMKERKKPPHKFEAKKSVFEELQFVPKREIDECVFKIKNLKIKGEQI